MALGHWAKNYLGGGNSNSGGGTGGGSTIVNLARDPQDEANVVADKTNAEILAAAENGPVLFRAPASLIAAGAEGAIYFPFQGFNLLEGVYNLYAGEAAGVKCEGAVSGQSGLAGSYPVFVLTAE